MHARLVTLALAGGIAVAACPGPTAAQPTAAQPTGTQAEALFQQGRALLTAGKYAEACAAFDASQELDPDISTLVNQANCREKNAQLASAWGLFVDVERQTRAATDASTHALYQVAADRATRLEARLSTLTIHVPDDHRIDGLEILRNGDRVAPATWNTALPIDGGSYQIAARAPGNADWSITITVGVERDPQTIEIPKLEAVPRVPPPASPRVAPREPVTAVQHRSILPLALAGGAVVLLGGAVGFARWGDRTYDSAKAAPDLATLTSRWHSANQKRYAAEAMLGAGIGCAGVAVWLWLRGRTESPPPTAVRDGEVTVAPLVNADMVGVSFGRRW